MKVPITRHIVIAVAVALIGALATQASRSAPNDRQIIICVSDTASTLVKQAADKLANPADTAPALKALLDAHEATGIVRASSESVLKSPKLAATNHLVIVGLKSNDTLLAKVWEHYVAVDEAAKTVCATGWGSMTGDIGVVAADWNPFLHTRTVKAAAFEAVEFKLSGTSDLAVIAAVDAFRRGLNNGFVPVGRFTRSEKSLLDLDPLTSAPPISFPASVSATGSVDLAAGVTDLLYAGWSQPPANEYRAFIDTGGIEPLHLWRAKYLQPGVFGAAWTPQAWVDGFHPMAWGNAVTVAEFGSDGDAAKVAAAVARSGGWRGAKIAGVAAAWMSDQPTDEVLPKSYGSVFVFSHGKYLILSSLPLSATSAIAASP